MIVVVKFYKKLIIELFRDKIMVRFYNDNKLQEILKEEPHLRDEFNTIIDSLRDSFANFDYQESSRLILEYFHFYDIVRSMANLPKNSKGTVLNKTF